MRNIFAVVLCLLVLSTVSVPAQSSVAQLAESGWRAVQKGDADTPATSLRAALMMRPRDPVLNLGAGVAAHLQGREQDAVQFPQTAVELAPRLTEASALLGEIAYHQGDLDFAIKTYEAAVTHAPRDPALKQRLDAWRSEASAYKGFETLKDDRFAVMFEGPVEQKLASRAAA